MTIIFHIGLPKTASTFLQKHVFPKVLSSNEYAFGEAAKAILKSGSCPNESRFLLSAEAWSNALISGGYKRNFRSFLNQIDAFPQERIRIIFFVRRHEDWLVSAYLQLAKSARFKPDRFSHYIQSFEAYDLSWHRRILDLSAYPIFVCRYESFASDPNLWVKKILSFIGCSETVDLTNTASGRYINLTPSTSLGLMLVRAMMITTNFPDMVSQKIIGRRLIFGQNGRTDFARVWIRDRVIRGVDSIPGQKPLKEILMKQIPLSEKMFFHEDWKRCEAYMSLD